MLLSPRPVPFGVFLLILLMPLTSCSPASSQAPQPAEAAPAYAPGTFGLVIHGGAGTITRASMNAETEAAYQAKLTEALEVGHAILAEGGTGLDAVVATLQVMEDSPLFNAGVGAVFTSDGTVELDASIMDGATRNAGAVAGVRQVESPIALARHVMEDSPHVMMMGEGAEAFARTFGIEMVPNEMFYTDRRRQQLEAAKARAAETSSRLGTGLHDPAILDADLFEPVTQKYGTVGAAALDQHGNLAAATSTGGMTNKRFGRVGDAPIIGAGTYADNETAAISATGHGEYFIRAAVAHDIASMMRYTGASLQEAARTVVMDKLTAFGGTGGIIAIDRQGNVAMPFNTEGMYRGHVNTAGEIVVKIYKD